MQIIATVACGTNACPTIFDSEEDVVVQGYLEPMITPTGEAAVRLPKELLLEAASKLQNL